MNREKEVIHLFSKRIPVDLIYLILDKEKEMIHKESKNYWERISPVYLYSIFSLKHQIIYQRDKRREHFREIRNKRKLEHIHKISGSLKTLKSSNLYIEM